MSRFVIRNVERVLMTHVGLACRSTHFRKEEIDAEG